MLQTPLELAWQAFVLMYMVQVYWLTCTIRFQVHDTMLKEH